MAENETLDPWGKNNNPRWDYIYRDGCDGADASEIARKMVDGTVEAWKNVCKWGLPVAELLDTVEGASPDIPRLRMQISRCEARVREYAQLFETQHHHQFAEDIMAGVVFAGAERLADAMTKRAMRDHPRKGVANKFHDALARAKPELKDFARSIAKNPRDVPKRPAKSSALREQQRRKLAGLSIVKAPKRPND